jgi:ribonucleotide reductase beta subunit family protein with ferritin-like domain
MQGPEFTHEDAERFRLLPIRNANLWGLYKMALGNFWTVEEVSLEDDMEHWERNLSDEDRAFVGKVLSFFAPADGQVADNLCARFLKMAWLPIEARFFYGLQTAVENIHTEMYQLLLVKYFPNKEDQLRMFAAAANDEAIRAKANWIKGWTEDTEHSDAVRLVAFACIEGIFFSSSFCAIFWLKKRGLMPGLSISNEWISRDEGLHCRFPAALLSFAPEGPPDEAVVHSIARQAADLECAFVRESLRVPLIGMNAEDMQDYVRFVTDVALNLMGYSKTFFGHNPFDWMSLSALQGKTNFFERRVADYKEGGAGRVGKWNADF